MLSAEPTYAALVAWLGLLGGHKGARLRHEANVGN
jgi:hypothetical protein